MDRKRGAAAAGQAWQLYSETLQSDAPGFWERLRAVPRMLKAVLKGEYKGMSVGTLGLLALGLVYIVWPLDAIPELLPVVGLVDDAGVAIWLATVLLRASGDFVRWERGGRPRAVAGDIID
ncbi:YkvA family protein [Actinomadura atramentaria]|uniref:YkvA family protein n=1 Tax=Actinomadura atramentaria TaxID=1990 RepID=UPI0003793AEB|nr:YkvA family protein [Actinomadura atramentaria]